MRVKRWEALADGIMDSAVVVRNEVLRQIESQDAATIARHNDAITRALAYIADQLGSRQWCEGTSITLADLAMMSALVYLDLRQAERDWRAAHPNLATWFAHMSERESVRITLDR
jgi:glutathione S-transferase